VVQSNGRDNIDKTLGFVITDKIVTTDKYISDLFKKNISVAEENEVVCQRKKNYLVKVD
jgi:hypothetical protein